MYVRETDEVSQDEWVARETRENEQETRKIRRQEEKRARKAEHGKNGECTDTSRQLPSCSN